MSTTKGAMLARASVRCYRNGSIASIRACRSVSSGPFVGSDAVIPPESPRYVYLPQPPQASPVTRVQRKGTLPIPRKPMKRTNEQLPWHLENTAPEKLHAPKQVNAKHRELAEWKAKESDLRRTNFIQGYSSLSVREGGRRGRGTKDGMRAARAAAKARTSPHMAPEPAYEEMSRPSIMSYMDKPQTWRAPKSTQEEIEARRMKYEQLQKAKEHERRADLHSLYVNAKDFIVNTEQLEKKLTEVYDSDFYQYNKDKDYGIWDEEGWPEDATYLLTRAQSSQGVSAADQESGFNEVARKRIKKVTEEMTGGKLLQDYKQASR